MVNVIKNGKAIEPEQLFNTFENVAYDLYPELKAFRDHIRKIGAPHLHLAGSGPSLYAIVKGREEAAELAARLQDQGMGVEVASTVI